MDEKRKKVLLRYHKVCVIGYYKRAGLVFADQKDLKRMIRKSRYDWNCLFNYCPICGKVLRGKGSRKPISEHKSEQPKQPKEIRPISVFRRVKWEVPKAEGE